jgi:hypothetical protein
MPTQTPQPTLRTCPYLIEDNDIDCPRGNHNLLLVYVDRICRTPDFIKCSYYPKERAQSSPSVVEKSKPWNGVEVHTKPRRYP